MSIDEESQIPDWVKEIDAKVDASNPTFSYHQAYKPSALQFAFSPFAAAQHLALAATVPGVEVNTAPNQSGYNAGLAGLFGLNPDTSGLSYRPEAASETGAAINIPAGGYESVMQTKYPMGYREAMSEWNPARPLWKAGMFLGEIGTDPTVWPLLLAAPGAAYARFAMAPRLAALRAAGLSGEALAAEAARGIAEMPAWAKTFPDIINFQRAAGQEAAESFFHKGWLFNRNPVADLAYMGRGGFKTSYEVLRQQGVSPVEANKYLEDGISTINRLEKPPGSDVMPQGIREPWVREEPMPVPEPSETPIGGFGDILARLRPDLVDVNKVDIPLVGRTGEFIPKEVGTIEATPEALANTPWIQKAKTMVEPSFPPPVAEVAKPSPFVGPAKPIKELKPIEIGAAHSDLEEARTIINRREVNVAPNVFRQPIPIPEAKAVEDVAGLGKETYVWERPGMQPFAEHVQDIEETVRNVTGPYKLAEAKIQDVIDATMDRAINAYQKFDQSAFKSFGQLIPEMAKKSMLDMARKWKVGEREFAVGGSEELNQLLHGSEAEGLFATEALPMSGKFSKTPPTERINKIVANLTSSSHVKEIKREGSVLHVEFNGGAKVPIKVVNEIEGEGLAAGERNIGVYLQDGEHWIKLVEPKAMNHELYHAARNMRAISEEDFQLLKNQFPATERFSAEEINKMGMATATEEAWVDGVLKYEQSVVYRKDDVIFKIIDNVRDLFTWIWEKATGKPTLRGALRRIEKGTIWEKKAVPSSEWQFSPKQRTGGGPVKLGLYAKEEVPTLSELASKSVMSEGEGFKGGPFERAYNALKAKGAAGEAFATVTEKMADVTYRAKTVLQKMMNAAVKSGEITAEYAKFSDPRVLIENLAGTGSMARMILEGTLEFGGKKIDYGRLALDTATKFLGPKAGRPAVEKLMGQADQFANAIRFIGEADDMAKAIIAFKKGDLNAVKELDRLGFSREQLSVMRDDPARYFDEIDREYKNWTDNFSGVDEAMQKAAADKGVAYTSVGDLQAYRNILAEFESKGLTKVLDDIGKPVRDLNEAKLRLLYDSELLTKAEFERLLRRKDYYSPVTRVFTEEELKGMGWDSELIKRFMGSSRQIENPRISSFRSLGAYIQKAHRNKVMTQILGPAFNAKEGSVFAEFVERIPEMEKNAERVWFQGEETFWRFKDPKVAEQIAAIGKNPDLSPGFWKIVAFPTRTLRGALVVSPPYMAFNFIRDSISRAILSPYSKNVFAGLKPFKEEDLQAYMKSGGLQEKGWFGDLLRTEYQKAQDRLIQEMTTDGKSILSTPDRIWESVKGKYEYMQGLSAKIEMRNRLAEFVAARKELKIQYPNTTDEAIDALAANAARNLLDFSVAGQWGRQLNEVVPFFNAGVQGTRRAFRAAIENPKAFAATMTAFGGVCTIPFVWAKATGTDKEYAELPAYQRDFFFNFKVPGTGYWLRIPKPFELGVVGTGFERAIDYMTGGEKSFWKYWGTPGYLGSVIKGVSPLDEGAILGPFRQAAEVMMNKDTFRDVYIVPPWEEKLAVGLRPGAKKSGYFPKAVAAMLGSDPRNVEHILGGFLADWGRGLSDIGKPERSIGESALSFARVLRKQSPYSFRSVQEVFQQQELKGQESSKESKSFREIVLAAKSAAYDPNVINNVLTRAKKENERLNLLTLPELAKKQSEKKPKRKERVFRY